MKITNFYELVFPIMGGKGQEDSSTDAMTLRQVLGTCFSISGDLFISAAHVIRDALTYPWAGIGFPYEGVWQGSAFLDSEIQEDFDIGIVKAEVPTCVPLKWSSNDLYMLQSVRTVGYPYALEFTPPQINIRSFMGYVVSNQKFPDLKAQPRIYELSFQAPRGLSGAPLFAGENVNGLVIGNRTTEMLIYRNKETVKDEQKETVVETYEALELGIAEQSSSILDIPFKMIGCTLRQLLSRNGMMT